MDISYFFGLFRQLIPGLQYTLGLFAITLLISLPLGLLLSFVRASRFKALRGILGVYIWLMRGTPLLLQLYFFYYGLTFIPGIGEYLVMDRFQAACVAFVLNYAAYFCEIFRGGLLSVDKGQYEAAKVLGFSGWQTSTKIVIPQMFRVCLPSLGNECITLVKDTSLITAIGVTELLYFAKSAVNRDVNATAYLVAALFYLAMTLVLTKILERMEKKVSY
ncbi:amino acid ABC transporter permease [Anaerolentibacter hominis]|uniref:amino acid ABC transporter permease n=1 Tax=Anaerolentibacter hominis TaxID=3079009 RepID=UPI0031B80668